jgi:hypothetical protein
MNDDKDTKRLGEDDESLAGDALVHAVRRDMLALFKALDQKVEGLNTKVDARLHDTVPLWEGVVSRLDAISAEQESQGKRLDVIEAEQRRQGARLDAIEARLDDVDRELRHLGRRVDRAVAELSGEVVKSRMDQHDLEDRVEKLEKTPA